MALHFRPPAIIKYPYEMTFFDSIKFSLFSKLKYDAFAYARTLFALCLFGRKKKWNNIWNECWVYFYMIHTKAMADVFKISLVHYVCTAMYKRRTSKSRWIGMVLNELHQISYQCKEHYENYEQKITNKFLLNKIYV